jgi:uncharacterized protein (TIGR02145 family)
MQKLFLSLVVILVFTTCQKNNTSQPQNNPSQPPIPVISTTNASAITANTATIVSNITSDGGATIIARGVCWNTLTSPTINNSKTIDGGGTGSFSSLLTGLTGGIRYYVRAYATNSAGTSYSNEISFTTQPPIPVIATITTTNASAITANTATIVSNITSDGGAPIIARGVCWNTLTSPTVNNSKTIDGGGTGSFSSLLTGLGAGTNYYVRAYATNSAGTSYSNEISFTTLSPSTLDITICSQIWMGKNLDVTTYRNGDTIPQVTDYNQWANLTTGAWCYFNNDPAMGAIYGKLYNWYAVNDPRGLAPAGYHIPTDAEWTILENCLGGNTIAGNAMRESGTAHWNSPNSGATNSSGFTGLPCAIRIIDGSFPFSYIGVFGGMWSSTEANVDNAWLRFLLVNYSDLNRNFYYKKDGHSVRCLKN